MGPASIDPGVRIGHVHLKVADIDRALTFYCGVLGFQLMQRRGPQAAFISAGDYHHHIGLNTWESRGGNPPPPGSTGLYHLAVLYRSRAALADALRRLMAAKIPLEGASDHGVSEALYLRDPDDNGVELYWDRPREQWPRGADGELAICSRSPNCCRKRRSSGGRSAGFSGRRRMNGKRMNAALELAGECRVDHAVALKPGLSAERPRYNIKAEVRLAARPMPGVSLVQMGFVFDAQALRRESRNKLSRYDVLHSHCQARSCQACLGDNKPWQQ